MSGTLPEASGASPSAEPGKPELLGVVSQVQRLSLEGSGGRPSGVWRQNVVNSTLSEALIKDLEATLTHSVPPLSQASLSVPAAPPEYLQVHLLEPAGEVSHERYLLMGVCFLFKATLEQSSAKWLAISSLLGCCSAFAFVSDPGAPPGLA